MLTCRVQAAVDARACEPPTKDIGVGFQKVHCPQRALDASTTCKHIRPWSDHPPHHAGCPRRRSVMLQNAGPPADTGTASWGQRVQADHSPMSVGGLTLDVASQQAEQVAAGLL